VRTFEIDGYEVWDTDGYTQSHLAYVSSMSLAIEMVGKDAYKGYSPCKKSFTVFDTMEEVLTTREANLRAAALAKLSPAERKALGL
jgi:hypothetical protein